MKVLEVDTHFSGPFCVKAAPVASGNMSTDDMERLLTLHGMGNVLKKLCAAVQCSNKLPNADHLNFLSLTNDDIGKKRTVLARELCALVSQLANKYAVTLRVGLHKDGGSDTDSIASLGVDDTVFDKVTQTTDEALDYFNRALDDARGIQDAIVPIAGGLGHEDAKKIGLLNLSESHDKPVALDIEKPQIHFPDYPIDNSDAPFVSRYWFRKAKTSDSQNETKPRTSEEKGNMNIPKKVTADNSLVSSYLDILFKNNALIPSKTVLDLSSASSPSPSSALQSSIPQLPHPFEEAISKAVSEMSKMPFDPKKDATSFRSCEDTPFTFVSTEAELFSIVQKLHDPSVKEIAVDLENHSVRSFQGFICLIQLSTRDEDFVIDALALRGCIHDALLPIFLNPSVVKVLHGADRDVQWMERDFGIYVVNLFDTGQASRLLKRSASLSHLLARYCSITIGAAKKKFQLADWRKRPLPDDQLAYARNDTHYLLHIFDRIRRDLMQKGGRSTLSKAWERSGTVARKRYAKVPYVPDMAKQLAARHGLQFDDGQMRLFEALCRWRDNIAREEDESIAYVSPMNYLLGIVRAKNDVRSVDGLLKHGLSKGFIPPMIQSNAEELVMLICDTLDSPPDSKEVIQNNAKPQKILGDIEMAQATLGLKSSNIANNETKGQSTSKRKNETEKDVTTKSRKTVSVDPGNLSSAPNICDDDGLNTKFSSEYDQFAPKVVVSDVDTTPPPLLPTKQPKLLVKRKRKSSLLGSDSESSSDEDEDDSTLASREMKRTTNSSEASSSPERNSSPTEEQDQKEAVGLAETVSRIHAELGDTFRAEIEPASNHFQVESDEAQHKNENERKLKMEEQKQNQVPEAKSIIEAYCQKKQNDSLMQKRKREPKKPVAEIDVIPFDYSRAKLEDEDDDAVERFDPMRKLQSEWKEDRPKVKKRKRGRGRSMSFKDK